VKLCRFDLADSPGTARSGIVYGPKVYETDGANPVGIHEWSEARLLSPVGQPNSLRFFPPLGGVNREAYDFRYLNPGILLGPNGSLPKNTSELAVMPCLGVVIAGAGMAVPVADADETVLGLTLLNVFYQPRDGDFDGLPAWALDAGAAIGPAITTPDELDGKVLDETEGRRYDLELVLSHNGVEIQRSNLKDLSATPAQILSFASLTCALKPGDLFAISLLEAPMPIRLKEGDHLRLVSEALGALVTTIS